MLISETKATFDRSNLMSVKQAYAKISADDFSVRTVWDAIVTAADTFPNKSALVMLEDVGHDYEPQIIDYKTLKAELIKAGNFLQSLGVKPGEPVALLAPPSIDGLIYFWASLSFFAVAPINPLLSAEVIAEICDELNVRILIAPPLDSGGMVDKVCQVLAGARTIEHVISEAIDPELSIRQKLYPASAKNCCSGEKLPEKLPTADTIAAYFHTGGTTGVPKVAQIVNRNLISGFVQTSLPAGISSDHVSVNGLPLFHVGGGVIATTGCLVLGQTLLQLTPLGYRTPNIANSFWGLVVKYGVTQVITVPTVYQDILRSYKGEKTQIKRFISSASKLPTSTLNSIKKNFGIDVLEGYGMTECTGFCCSSVSGLPVKAGATGIAVPNFNVRTAVIENGEIQRFCDANEVGDIVVQGPGVFAGYTDPEKNKIRFVIDPVSGETWLNSEDLGRVDEDGYLFVVGRSKDLIIRSGHNIDPATVEDALLGYRGVMDAAAVGMPDPRAGELPVAFVVMETPSDFNEELLREWCREHIKESGAVPVHIFPLTEMPRTAMNKIFKPALSIEATKIGVSRILGHSIDESAIVIINVKSKRSGQIYIELTARDREDKEAIDNLMDQLSRLGLEIMVAK